MYLQHFGLVRGPFENTPNTRFFFAADSHKEALAAITYGIDYEKGVVLVTGDIGTGKTLLLHKLKEQLRGKKNQLLDFDAPAPRPKELYRALAKTCKISVNKKLTKKGFFKKVKKALTHKEAAGIKVILLFDDAQELPDKTLVTLRHLADLELSDKRLLQIVMLAQPDLLLRLQRPPFKALLQRVSLYRTLNNFSEQETIAYITFRCQTAGAQRPLFTDRAMQLIHQASQGVPRLINHICDNALLAAYADDLMQVDLPSVQEVLPNCPALTQSSLTALPREKPKPATAYPVHPVHRQQQPPEPPREPAQQPETGPETRMEPSVAPHMAASSPAPAPTPSPRKPDAFSFARDHSNWLWLLGIPLLAYFLFTTYQNQQHDRSSALPRLNENPLSTPAPVERRAMPARPSRRVKPEMTEKRPIDEDAYKAPEPTETNPLYDNELDRDIADIPLKELLDLPPDTPEEETEPAQETAVAPAPQRQAPLPVEQTAKPAPVTEERHPTTPPRQASRPIRQQKEEKPLQAAAKPQAIAPKMQPANPPPSPAELPLPDFSDEQPGDRVIHIARGQYLNRVVAEEYGAWNATMRDIVQAANPHIADLDRIARGTPIRLPKVTPERLIVKKNGWYYVYLRTVFGEKSAQRLARQLSRKGISVVRQPLPDRPPLQRIFLGPYSSWQAADQVAQRIQFSAIPQLR